MNMSNLNRNILNVPSKRAGYLRVFNLLEKTKQQLCFQDEKIIAKRIWSGITRGSKLRIGVPTARAIKAHTKQPTRPVDQ